MLSRCSAAAAPKVFCAAFASTILSSFLCADGSRPELSSLLASSRFSRAVASVTSGYEPNEISFSLPAKRYLSRHSLLPLGCTSTCNPLPSSSLNGFSRGFDVRIAQSLNTWEYRLPNGSQNTPKYPPAARRCKINTRLGCAAFDEIISLKSILLVLYAMLYEAAIQPIGARGGSRTPMPCGDRF